MKHRYEIKDKRIFITGAARGIGAAVAKRLHQQGAYVALVGLEVERLKAIADELGERAIYFEVDVSDKNAVQNAATGTVSAFGRIDIVIANAGIYQVSPLTNAASSAIERTLNVNLYGVWNTLHATLPEIQKNKGYVLTITSMAALTHGPLMGAYAASKAAVEALTDSLRIELKPENVGVGCAYFGAIDTDLVQGGKQHPALAKMEKMMPAFIRTPAPLAEAVDVIEAGIRDRSARIWAPRWLSAVFLLRGAMQPLLEWRLAHDKRTGEALILSHEISSQNSVQDHPLGVARLATEKISHKGDLL